MALAVVDKEALLDHYGHEIEIAVYGDEDNPYSVTIECMYCNEVLIDTEEE